MNVAIVGTRGHQGMVLDALTEIPDLNISGMCFAPDKPISWLVDELQNRNQSPKEFESVGALLDWKMPDIVSLAGPFEESAATCSLLLNQGVHVFAEKPPCMNLDELRTLEDSIKGSNAHLGLMMSMRQFPSMYTAKGLIETGRLGSLHTLQVQKSYKLKKRPEYFHSCSTFPGLIPWVGIHALDLVLWMSGKSWRSVTSFETIRNNRQHGDLGTSAQCLIELQDETAATVSIDYLRPDNAATHEDDRIRIVGSEGILEVKDKVVTLLDQTGETSVVPNEQTESCFGRFVSSLQNNSTPPASGDEAVELTRLALMARDSVFQRSTLFNHG